MSRRLTGALLAVAGILIAPGTGSAGEGGGVTTTTTASSNPSTIAATAGRQTAGGRDTSAAAPSTQRCSFEPFDLATSGVPTAGAGIARRDATTNELTVDALPGQNTETLYRRACPGQALDYVWVADVVDVDALITSAYESVLAQIPTPSLDMNPRPEVGGIVNIGLWLAVENPGRVSITASVGPVWATVTATYRGTTWEFGNGDSIYCEGVGTPIVDTSTEEQGPCGYTYRWPSAPKFTDTDDLAYHARATGHWVIAYATSTGRAGSLAPIDRERPFLYQVREIQTVRVSPNGPPPADEDRSSPPGP
jgi:hypothetical protein